MGNLRDLYGRNFTYLRLSLTDVCNFRCLYCLPNGNLKSGGKNDILSVTEIGRLINAFSEIGFSKVRFTGGEPTVRRDLLEIIRVVAKTPGIKKTALSTNGFRLRYLAEDLLKSGLRNLNVSMDSLNATRFAAITGQNKLEDVRCAIDIALELGFQSVKVNTVLLNEVNDDEIDDFIGWTYSQPISVRFIELMQTGDNREFFYKHHYSANDIYRKLLASGWIPKEKEKNAGPAVEFVHADFRGSVGVIAPYAKDFCLSCNRLRVDCYGRLFLCLFDKSCFELRHLLKADSQKEELKQTVIDLVLNKAKSHSLHDGDPGMRESLVGIGG